MELKQNKLKNNVIFPCKKPFLFLSGVDMLGMFPYQECLRMCKRKRKEHHHDIAPLFRLA